MQTPELPARGTTAALAGMALVALLLLGGCGGDRTTLGTPATVRFSTTATPPTGPVALSESSAGRTVQVHRGDRVVLTLHNTYWHIAPPDGRILTQTGSQKVSPAPVGTCRPGVGCGTVQAVFIASATGSTEITASRTVCGEAMACPPGQGSYVTHLIVG